MTVGFVLRQPLILICAGAGWSIFGVMMYMDTADTVMGTALMALGASFALVCFVWPLTIWLKGRADRLSSEDQDYEDYRRKVENITRR